MHHVVYVVQVILYYDPGVASGAATLQVCHIDGFSDVFGFRGFRVGLSATNVTAEFESAIAAFYLFVQWVRVSGLLA